MMVKLHLPPIHPWTIGQTNYLDWFSSIPVDFWSDVSQLPSTVRSKQPERCKRTAQRQVSLSLYLCTALADLCPPVGRAGANKAVLDKCNTSPFMKDIITITSQTPVQKTSRMTLEDWRVTCEQHVARGKCRTHKRIYRCWCQVSLFQNNLASAFQAFYSAFQIKWRVVRVYAACCFHTFMCPGEPCFFQPSLVLITSSGIDCNLVLRMASRSS